MEFQYHGANCITITTKKATFVIDDNLASLGAKSVTKPETVALFTQIPKKAPEARLVIEDPGEYEVSEVSIFGIGARAHMDEKGTKSATIYKIQTDDLKIAVLGHIHPDISDDELEELDMVDVLFIPVGGSGYTLDPVGALSLIKKIEPKIVIPTHFDDSTLKYEVPQVSLGEAVKAFGMEPKDTLTKFKPKPADFSETTQLVILERQ